MYVPVTDYASDNADARERRTQQTAAWIEIRRRVAFHEYATPDTRYRFTIIVDAMINRPWIRHDVIAEIKNEQLPCPRAYNMII